MFPTVGKLDDWHYAFNIKRQINSHTFFPVVEYITLHCESVTGQQHFKLLHKKLFPMDIAP